MGNGIGNCSSVPEIFYESMVYQFETYVKDVEFKFYDNNQTQKFSGSDARKLFNAFNLASTARCYTLIPPENLQKKKMYRIKFNLHDSKLGRTKIQIHFNGGYFSAKRSKERIILYNSTYLISKVDYEVYQMLDSKKSPCVEDKNYNRDFCIENEIDEVILSY